jgi:hypothetical protein
MNKARAEKPLLFGYHSARPAIPCEQLVDVRRKLTVFASTEGYALAGIFSEANEQPATALQAMLDSAERRHVEAVAISTLSDLGSDERMQRATRERLEGAGIRLLVLVGGAA